MSLAKLFNTKTENFLSSKEMAVLYSVAKHGGNGASCADVQGDLLEETKKEPRLATLYSIFSGLERKGLIAPHVAVRQENGGRPRQVFRISPSGRRALTLGEEVYSLPGNLLVA